MSPWETGDARPTTAPLRPLVLAAVLAIALVLGVAGVLTAGGGLAFAQESTPSAAQDEGDLSVADVAELANPAVVTIRSRQEGAFGQNGPRALGAGSGFIIDAEGHVVTNSHVVEDADELSVEFFDGTTVQATLVGRDELQDVAVLQLDLADCQEVPGIVTLGDSDTVRAGDRIVSIGSALGEFTNTVTDGTVNAVDRSLAGLPNLLQHDAEIWPGNSGGPILNLKGEVVGVNVAGVGNRRSQTEAARIGFAIEIDAVEDVVADLLDDGVVVRPFLGIAGGPVADGQEVVEVVEGGPADEAGVLPGDVITAINGQSLDGENGLLEALFEFKPGDTVTLTIDRDGTEETIEVVLAERPAETD